MSSSLPPMQSSPPPSLPVTPPSLPARHPSPPAVTRPSLAVITAGPTDKSYEPAVWALVAVILLLVAAIVCYVVCSKRRQMQASGPLGDQ